MWSRKQVGRKTTHWMGLLLMAALPSAVSAIEPDAEYRVREKQFGEQWAAEDKQVREKLAALERRFGKKPNIVFILGDDIGYTELGCYGGGKVRGFSTPNLDKMAAAGMRLLSFYSEPACTPTRMALMTGRHPVRVWLYGARVAAGRLAAALGGLFVAALQVYGKFAS